MCIDDDHNNMEHSNCNRIGPVNKGYLSKKSLSTRQTSTRIVEKERVNNHLSSSSPKPYAFQFLGNKFEN